MKVLMFLRMGEYSGAENVACQIIALLKGEVEVVYASPDGHIREILKEKKVDFFPLKKNSISEYKRAIRSVNPDIIHAHDMATSLLAAISCGKVPLLLQIHNNAFNSRRVNLKSILFQYAANKAKRIIWVSESSFAGYYYHEKYKSKSSVLYNIIDTETLQLKANSSITTEKFDIVYIGRLTYQKNPQRLIRVLEKVVKICPDVKVAIIGTGDMEEEIRTLIYRKKLENNLKMLGFLTNPYVYMKNARFLIMTSRWEGTPMVCLEALAMGLPIVSTPVDGIMKLVENEKNGFLSEKDDLLAEYCVTLLRDDRLWKKMSSFAQKLGQSVNDKEKYKNEILNTYKLCIEED